MTTALLTCLESSGLTLKSHAGQLLVSPASRLTEELRTLIRDNRATLLQALAPRRQLRTLPNGAVVLDTDPDGWRWLKTVEGQIREDCVDTLPMLGDVLMRRIKV